MITISKHGLSSAFAQHPFASCDTAPFVFNFSLQNICADDLSLWLFQFYNVSDHFTMKFYYIL